ncbi:MAG: SAM-dependent methyltransferase [Halieaceae bacterium]|jgi:SAM-dependent methyltransferase
MTDTLRDAHPMMPAANHDELAEQMFILGLKGYIAQEINPREKALAEALDSDTEQTIEDRSRQVRNKMLDYDSYRAWLGLNRTAQEEMWEAIKSSISRQADDLNTRGKIESPEGSLRLDPDFLAPAYLRAGDTHMMPGGYHADPGEGSIEQGALMDRGGAIYMLTLSGGLMNDGRGQTAMSHVLTRFPDLKPKRILDMGCGVGASTLPAVQCFPDAEVHGFDVGASVMRYAHARAEKLGLAVHFSQQSAEHTDFEDESFDLIYSCAMFHETSHAAVPNIMRECYRLLRPGGVVVHTEVPIRYDDLDLWGLLIGDFETRYNNEPFWAGALKTDFAGALNAAGFKDVETGFQTVSRAAKPGEGTFSDENLGVFRCWYAASGRK